MASRILLTGASGFIGRNIAPLIALKHDISTLGRSVGSDFRFDLSNDIPALGNRPFDTVIHAAGLAHKRKGDFSGVNVTGTRNLCKALEAMTHAPKRLIYLSSVAVYGLSRGENIAETTPLNPQSHYAESKAEAELFLQNWCATTGTKLTILRPALVAGKDAPGNIGKLMAGLRLRLYISLGKGAGARKSVVAVSDIARVAMLAADKGGTYNICSDYAPGFREIEAKICEINGLPKPICVPKWAITPIAPLSATLSKILSPLTFDNSLAKSSLGWQPLPWWKDLEFRAE